MCGIAGLVGPGGRNERLVRRMIAPIAHRGPDGEGVWIDSDAGIALGHRRLAIIDLSPAGHQPMASGDGRFVIAFNGEVYNHAEIRRSLENESAAPDAGWRGHSDTETLVQAIAAWGVERTIAQCAGMFAFALWDRRDRTLSLVTDRFGEKPLYFGRVGQDFVFGSELKALKTHPQFDSTIDRAALEHFVQRNYVPAPLSIYEGISKLPPASILELRPAKTSEPHIRQYWSYREVVERGLADPLCDHTEAIQEIERVLGAAVSSQLVADVPVGVFLSGGIDSSLVAALGQKHSATPLRTFSIGFEDSAFNEADHAAAVARHLGTAHSEHYVTVSEARDVIPLLPTIYDEPFADSSQIPTFLVSRFARGQVTVALTGDGGDELFGGYNRHLHGPRLWKQIRRVPSAFRALAGATLGRLPAPVWQWAGELLAGQKQASFGPKLQKALRISGRARSFDQAYLSLLDEWSFDRSPVIGAPAGAPREIHCGAAMPDTVRAMYCDAVGYLPGDILCKVDRASMAVSLETRVPFLDHRVAELASRIPVEMKIGQGEGKRILRELLYRHLPRELIDRPKAGFAVPVGEWVKGPLRDWAEELLDPGAMASAGWFDPALVQRRWHDHLSGRRDSTAALWSILMFQAWLAAQRGEAGDPPVTHQLRQPA